MNIDTITGKELLAFLEARMDEGAVIMTGDKKEPQFNHGFEVAVLGFHALCDIIRGKSKEEAARDAGIGLLKSYINATA